MKEVSGQASKQVKDTYEQELARESREFGWSALFMAAGGVFLIWLSSNMEKPDPEISGLGGLCFVPLVLWVLGKLTRA